MFPVEIWENILHKIDAKHLLHLRTVNKTLNCIITKHLEKSDAWYKQCEIDIPKEYWNLLLENSFHSATLKRQLQNNKEYDRYGSQIWITLYKAYMKWKNVHSFDKCITEQFSPLPKHRKLEKLTCCSTLGELVAVGSNEGYIKVFNLKTNNMIFSLDTYRSVASVKLWVQGKNQDKIILIITSHDKKFTVWDIVERKVLRSRRIGYAACAGHSYYCIGLKRGIIVVNSLTLGQNFCMTYRENDYPVSMMLNMDMLYFFYNDGSLYEINLRGITERGKIIYVVPQCTNLKPKIGHKILNYYLFNPLVAFCVTERGLLGISVYKSNWEFHNIFPFLEGSITAIHYNLSLLAIGLNYGCICLFSVKDPLGLKKINFKNARKIQVANEPIVSINTMELAGDQRLLVTSSCSFYNIQLSY